MSRVVSHVKRPVSAISVDSTSLMKRPLVCLWGNEMNAPTLFQDYLFRIDTCGSTALAFRLVADILEDEALTRDEQTALVYHAMTVDICP